MLAERDMILAYDSDFFGLLVASYRRTVGAEPAFFEPGLPGRRPSAAWLYDEARHPVLAHKGFTTGYSGWRIAKSGRRFFIEDGVVWQLIDEDGAVRGQAATCAKWRDA